MLKKTIFVENKTSITTQNEQLVLKNDMRESTIPIEDIGFLVLDNTEIYISIPSIIKLSEYNVAVIFCDKSHLPLSMLLNLNSHYIQQEIFRKQTDASAPLKKNLWQQTIQEKIKNQGKLLEKVNGKKNQFGFLKDKVLSGDSSNMEAVAAVIYWKEIFKTTFKRERFGDYPNNFLNYGYAILRAATARALAGSGLLNTLGIHHRNKYNAFALADDMMEPYRPLVDEKVIELMQNYDEQELNSQIKQELLQLLTRTVFYKDEKSTLMIALQRTASSLQQCFTEKRKKITFADLWN